MGENNVEEKKDYFQKKVGIIEKIRKRLYSYKVFSVSTYRFCLSIAISFLVFFVTSISIMLFPKSIYVALLSIISLIPSIVWVIIETVSLTINKIGEYLDKRSVVRRLSSFSSWVDSTRFGEIGAVKVYLDENDDIKKAMEAIKEDVYNYKLQNSNEYYHSNLNYKGNFKFFRKSVESFSKLSIDELKDIKAYLKIPPKKYWILQISLPFFGTLGSVFLLPKISLFVDTVAKKYVKTTDITGFQGLINLLDNQTIGFILCMLFYLSIMYIEFKVLLARQRAINEHSKNYIFAVVDRALEIKMEDDNS